MQKIAGYKSIKEAKVAIKERREGEVNRYKERYNVDLEDEENYDLIIDTSYSSVDDIADTILRCNEEYMQGKSFGKKWASPKIFLPLQSERETLGMGRYMNINEVLSSIKTKGYNPSEPIETIKVDGKYYIIEGHHRNFGTALAKKTLVPYVVLAENDEYIKEYSNTARQRTKGTNERNLRGHEWMISDDFSYDEVYHNIYEPKTQDEPSER